MSDHIRATLSNFPKAAWLNVAAGVAVGFVIGVPPMLIHFQSQLSDCSLITSEARCIEGTTQPRGSCFFDVVNKVCIAAADSGTPCNRSFSAEMCVQASSMCAYSEAHSQCEQIRGWGWANAAVGTFASAAVTGAVLGTVVASGVARHEQMKRVNQFGNCVSFGAVIAWLLWIFTNHTAWGTIGFALSGVGMGGLMTLAPAVVSAVVPAAVRDVCATFFQLSITIGICCSALVALIFQSAHSFAPHALHMMCAASGMLCYYVADSVAAPIVIEHFMSNPLGGSESVGGGGVGAASNDGSPTTTGGGGGGGGLPGADSASVMSMVSIVPQPVDSAGPPSLTNANANDDHDTASLISVSSSASSSAPNRKNNANSAVHLVNAAAREASNRHKNFVSICYATGITLGISLQIGGISAVMSYASRMTAAAGMTNPLLGNFLIMFFNAISCLPALFLASRYTAQFMYLTGLGVSSVFSIVTALSMLTGNAAFSLVCICGFIVFFEAAAPFFFILMCEVFSSDIRSVAVGRVTLANFVTNIVVVAVYPALCSALAPAGDPDGGVRRVFVLFGVLGLVCTGALHALFPHTNLAAKTSGPPSPEDPSLGAGAADRDEVASSVADGSVQ